MLSRPGLIGFVCFMIGQYLALNFMPLDWRPGAILSLCALSALFFTWRNTLPRLLLFVLLLVGLGAMRQAQVTLPEYQSIRIIEEYFPPAMKVAVVEGTVVGFPRRNRGSWSFPITDVALGALGERKDLPGGIVIQVGRSDEIDALVARIVPGDSILGIGPVETFPMEMAATESGYFWRNQGYVAIARFRHLERADVDDAYAFCEPLRWTSIAGIAAERVYTSRLSPQMAAIASAMTLGRTDRMSEDQKSAYRRTGLFHIFAVSGLHTVLVGGMFMVVLNFFGLPPIVRIVLLSLALLFFCSLVGMRSSVIRAALLMVAWESRSLLKRPFDPLGTLGTIALLMQLWEPRSLWQIDFQMTFLCLVAISLSTPWSLAFRKYIGEKYGWGWRATFFVRCSHVLIISLAIQIALYPIMLHHFGEVSIISPIANLFFLPLASLLVQVLFFLLLLSSTFPTLGGFLIAWLDPFLKLMDWGVGALSHFPGAMLQAQAMTPILVLIWFVVILGGAWSRFKFVTAPQRSIAAFIFSPALLLIVAVWAEIRPTDSTHLDVWFLDVGQGDATLISAGNGARYLIDAGPPSAGFFLADRLRHLGVRKLDALFMTHADQDHIGGMAELLKRVQVDRLYVNGSKSEAAEFKALEEIVLEKSIPVFELRRGDRIPLTRYGHTMEVLHPTDSTVAESADRNETSLVLWFEYGGRAMLLTGDAEAKAEAEMLAAGAVRVADLLKLGHHGSAGSSGADFLSAVQPVVAIASCGRLNRYNHPAKEVMERLEAIGSTLHRTDVDGTIHVQVKRSGEMRIKTSRERLSQVSTLEATPQGP